VLREAQRKKKRFYNNEGGVLDSIQINLDQVER